MELQPLLLIPRPLQRFDPKERVNATLGSNEFIRRLPHPDQQRWGSADQNLSERTRMYHHRTFGGLPFDESE
jgi:hypothetical protein